MADNNTGLYVQTVSGQFVSTKIVDSGGTNVAAVSAAGRVSVDASGVPVPITDNTGSLTVDAPVGTPVYVRLSDGAANLIGQKTMANSLPVVFASDQSALSVTLSSSVVDTELPTAGALADAAANPTTPIVGAAGLTFNGTTWDRRQAVRAALDSTGTGIAAAGIMGQFDDAATAAVTENQFAPVRISTRRALLVEGVASGTPVVGNISQIGGASLALGQATMAASVPVVIASNQSSLGVDTELLAPSALADATANPTITQIAGYLMGYNGTTWDRVRTANTGRLQVDVVTGGGTNASVFVDNSAFTPDTSSATVIAGLFDDTAGSALTENDVATARIDSKRALILVGEDATTRSQKWAISAAGALASNLTQIGGATPSATVFVPNRLTDGTAYYTRTGQTQATGVYSAISDGTTVAGVIVGTTALKTDTSSVGGTAVVTGGISGAQGVAGALAHDAAAAAMFPVGVGFFASAAAPTAVSADGDIVKGWALLNGSQVFNLASGGTLVTLGQKAMTGSLPVVFASDQSALSIDTELPAAVSLADATANPTVPGVGGFLMGYNGSTWDRIRTANTGRLQVDVVSGATGGAPTSPQFSTQTSAALGAGSNIDLSTADITNGKTGRLAGIDVASTVPLKVIISTVAASTPTTRVVLFAQPYSNLQWRSPYMTYITQAGGTNNKFRVNATNKDASVAADVYATFYWDEV